MAPVSNPLLVRQIRRGLRLRVENRTRGCPLVEELVLALDPWRRLRGLLGRPPLRAGQGMLIRPCRGVHTYFMGYPIDVLFVDSAARVVAVCGDLAPWRTSPWIPEACCVLELAAGQAAGTGTVGGDQLAFLEV